MSLLKFTIFLYIFSIVFLFFYSFTQVDLGLTFTRNESLQEVFRWFQHIGYFNRPISTGLYSGIVFSLFIAYGGFLWLAQQGKLAISVVWKLLIITTVIFMFSYNAFSYDLFNYIFDAKIITTYQQNPYVHKALDFPADPMLAFMHWTHRVYPYGPAWLGITVPLSYLGFGFFFPTFFLFKVLMAASFLGSAYFISKIFQKSDPKQQVLGLVFFGFNPLILIESLISSHIDIVMVFFALWAWYLLLKKRYLWAVILLLISIGIKFATAFLIPVFLLVILSSLRAKRSNTFRAIAVSPTALHNDRFLGKMFLVSIMLLFATTIIASLRTNFQPWYLLPPLAFATFLSYRSYIVIPSFIFSFFALSLYIPYLYSGNWDPPIPTILLLIQGLAVCISVLVVFLLAVYPKPSRNFLVEG